MSEATGRSCSREPPCQAGEWPRVYKGTIDSLSTGEGIIEGGGRFQPFGYKEIPFPDGSLLVRPNGRATEQFSILKRLIGMEIDY